MVLKGKEIQTLRRLEFICACCFLDSSCPFIFILNLGINAARRHFLLQGMRLLLGNDPVGIMLVFTTTMIAAQDQCLPVAWLCRVLGAVQHELALGAPHDWFTFVGFPHYVGQARCFESELTAVHQDCYYEVEFRRERSALSPRHKRLWPQFCECFSRTPDTRTLDADSLIV
ncbi:hypothetical protein K432DRAFT_49622 [Lepidopterella palustris CBS 459.81]|uniref:Uncharacterized protein n=1 Tax=Lepidopterella palustris CBS 459.81 TaxID=1314670 RepID=A0A8E2JFP0_9PEZI|nr:hypothetical protein K432DRAFT_49622 [Lepidopterella palustris CBS 459.81]